VSKITYVTINPGKGKGGVGKNGIIDSPTLPRDNDRRRFGGEEWEFYDLGTRLNVVDAPSDATFVGLEGNEPAPVLDPAKYLEYVEIKVDVPGEFTGVELQSDVPRGEYDPYGNVAQNVQADIEDATDISDIDRKFLGIDSDFDPFGFSSFNTPPNPEDKKAREIPNCMPIWYGRSDQPGFELADDPEAYDPEDYVGEVGYNEDIFDIEAYTPRKVTAYGNANMRISNDDIALLAGIDETDPEYLQQTWEAMEKVPNPNWKPDNPRQDGEQWNSLNQETDGYLNLKGKSGSVQIRLKSRLAYEEFDTGDTTNYKITAVPDYNGQEVKPRFKHKSDLKFYLRPKLHAFCRRLVYTRSTQVQWETYRSFSFPFWYNQQFYGPNSSDSQTGGFAIFEPFPEFRGEEGANSGPFTFTAVIVVDRVTGGITISGLPDGTVTDQMSPTLTGWEYTYPGPNYTIVVTAVAAPNPPTPSSVTLTISTEPAWGTAFPTITNTCEVMRGTHVSRYTVMPMNLSQGGWASYTYPFAVPPQTYTYLDGTTKEFSFEESVQFDGRVLFLDYIDFAKARQMYQKRTSRDTKDIVHFRPLYALSTVPKDTQTPDLLFPDEENSIQWRHISDIAETKADLDSQVDALIADVLAQLETYDHIRNTQVNSFTSTLVPASPQRWYMLPIDGRIGQLCGVIIKGKQKYYVWRKTNEERGGDDHDRSIGTSRYSGTIT
jgi:hypothetical protein